MLCLQDRTNGDLGYGLALLHLEDIGYGDLLHTHEALLKYRLEIRKRHGDVAINDLLVHRGASLWGEGNLLVPTSLRQFLQVSHKDILRNAIFTTRDLLEHSLLRHVLA